MLKIKYPKHKAIFFFTLFIYLPTVNADHTFKPSLSIGGRVKIDAIYNDNSVGGNRTSKSDLAFSPTSIPLADNKNDFDVNLRESRVWGTLHIPVFEETLSTYVEFDFFDTTRDSAGRAHVANTPRLRHLYASFMNLTVGKTYTTFVNMSAYPVINDANGPVGVLSIRPDWIARFSKKLSFAELFLSLEKPESRFTSSSGSSFQVNDDHIPDIVGKLVFSNEQGNWSVSAMAREINNDGKVANGVDKTYWGGAISTAGRLFINDQDNLRFTLSYGNALGRYMSYGAFNDAVMDSTGKINLTEILAAYAAYQHWWTANTRSSFILGGAYANHDTNKTVSSVNEYFASSMINFLWSPTLKTTVGIEWLHAYRELHNGQNGNIDRIQLSAIYKF